MSEPTYLYTSDGIATESCPEHLIYAKSYWDGKQRVYMIKHATSGPEAPHLLNPWSMYYTPELDSKRLSVHSGKKRYEFKKVNKDVFYMYITFLETRNALYYRQAERGLD